MAWFLTLYFLVRRYEDKINQLSRGLIELLGRNSLFVYISHAFIVYAFKLFIPPITNIYQNFIITAGALAALFGTTLLYQRRRDAKTLKKNSATPKNSSVPAIAAK